MECISEIRYYHFMAGVLAQQQQDPFCSICKAFTNSVRAVREGISGLEERMASEVGAMPEEQVQLLTVASRALTGLHPDPEAAGQKKAGNCRLPEGICFIKSSKVLITGMA